MANGNNLLNNNKKAVINAINGKDKDVIALHQEVVADEKKFRAEKNGKMENVGKWKKPNTLKTNLIQGKSYTFFDWKKNSFILAAYVLSVVLLVTIAYAGLVYWEKDVLKPDQAIQSQIKLADELIEKRENVVEITDFQSKLEMVSLMIKDHIYWTEFFNFLEKHTLPGVYYNQGSFSGRIDGEYKLSGTTDSYESVANQIKVFKSLEEVEAVVVENATMDPVVGKEYNPSRDTNFQMELNINPAIFNK